MRLTVNEYEVEIKVKRGGAARVNKMDTMQFLNSVSIWAMEAAKQMRTTGAPALAEEFDDASNEIYHFLKDAGLYK